MYYHYMLQYKVRLNVNAIIVSLFPDVLCIADLMEYLRNF